jgi:hypothetical protein
MTCASRASPPSSSPTCSRPKRSSSTAGSRTTWRHRRRPPHRERELRPRLRDAQLGSRPTGTHEQRSGGDDPNQRRVRRARHLRGACCCTPTWFPRSPRARRSRGETGHSRRRSHTGRIHTRGRKPACRTAGMRGEAFRPRRNRAHRPRSLTVRRRRTPGSSRSPLRVTRRTKLLCSSPPWGPCSRSARSKRACPLNAVLFRS